MYDLRRTDFGKKSTGVGSNSDIQAVSGLFLVILWLQIDYRMIRNQNLYNLMSFQRSLLIKYKLDRGLIPAPKPGFAG